MEKHHHRHHTFSYFARNLSIAVGLVLIWRGIWYMLDGIDYLIFGGEFRSEHLVTATIGTVIGVLILYIPDKDLKELSKL